MATIIPRREKQCVVYWYTVPDVFDEKGRPVRKQKWETYNTYDEALSRKKEVEDKIRRQIFTPPLDMTVSDLLVRYFSLYGSLKWSYKTYASYWIQEGKLH